MTFAEMEEPWKSVYEMKYTAQPVCLITDHMVIREYCRIRYPDADGFDGWKNHYQEAKGFADDLKADLIEKNQTAAYTLDIDSFSDKHIAKSIN